MYEGNFQVIRSVTNGLADPNVAEDQSKMIFGLNWWYVQKIKDHVRANRHLTIKNLQRDNANTLYEGI